MLFVHLPTNKIVSENYIKYTHGVSNLTEQLVSKLGYKPVTVRYPTYDKVLYTIKRQENLIEDSSNPNHYIQAYNVEYLPIDTIRANIKEQITDKRWNIETGGLTLPNGVKVLTGIADQNRIATSIRGMETAKMDSINFKADSGWVTLTIAELRLISIAITKHVEACFARECELHKLCDNATTEEELQNIYEHEMHVGWPTYENTVE